MEFEKDINLIWGTGHLLSLILDSNVSRATCGMASYNTSNNINQCTFISGIHLMI
jgi:hypothetical protein